MKNKCVVILRNNNKDIISNLSIYEIIEFCIENNIQFVVCHVEETEYKTMKNDIDRMGCVSEEHFGCSETSYNHFRWMAAFDMKNGIVKFADSKESNCSLSHELNLESGHFESPCLNLPFYKEHESGKYDTGLKIYTTETIEDIILHYNKPADLKVSQVASGEENSNKVLIKKQEISNLRQHIYHSCGIISYDNIKAD